MERRILPHFGIAADADSLGAARAAAQWDAKSPSFAFEPDAEGKRRNAGDAVCTASAAHLDAAHRVLTALAARR